jgi:predicted Na+-dependent transporter
LISFKLNLCRYAAACLHSGGFALGYASSAAFGFKEADRRTVSIEAGSFVCGRTAVAFNQFS